MDDRMTGVEVGDWVQVYLNSKLTILEVRYVRLNGAGTLIVSTDHGEIGTREILEVRRLAEWIKGDGA